MKTLQEIRAEFAALSTVTEDQFETALSAALADLDAVIGASPATPDPVVTVTTTTQSGVTEVFVPQSA